MRTPLHSPVLITILLVACEVLFRSTALPQRSPSTLLERFKNPPADLRSAPLWVWNDRVTPAEIDEQLADFQHHGIGGVFIHPRPGLITPYLSDDWLSLCRHAVSVGKKLGMKIWIYDENSYPSGFAGGIVPAQMPDARRTGLCMTAVSTLPATLPEETILILARDSTGFVDVTARRGPGVSAPGDYRIFSLVREKPRVWHGGFTYVDIMRPEVTKKFIDVTMNAYKRVIGDEFGGVVPGVFQDEAEINPAGEPGQLVVNYTPTLFDRFHTKWGYDLRTHLPSLFDETGDWRRVRHDFYATTLELFLAGWAMPYYEYCTANNLLLTGHYWEHEWPRAVINPDNMAFAAYAHIPGIDILMNDLQMDSHAQFGNDRAVREIRSVANQLGKTRTLSETFGAGGWDMSFFDQKRIADWEFALGVNLLNQHLSYMTIAGARKRDHPLSFSYHEPWWASYRMLGDYYGRLTVALTAGEQINRILVLEPTTTGWMYTSAQRTNPLLDSLGRTFQDFVHSLEAGQVEYDLASEDILRNHGGIQGRGMVVGNRTYDLVVLPPGLETLDRSTLALLHSYLAAGGTLLSCGTPPGRIDGRVSDEAASLSASYPDAWIAAGGDDPVEKLHRLVPHPVAFLDQAGKPSSFPLLFHHRRVLKEGDLLFVANTDSTKTRTGFLLANGGSCEEWNLFTGGVRPRAATGEKGKLKIPFSLPPGGSMLVRIQPTGRPTAPQPPARRIPLAPDGELGIRRSAPNVLTLDYCDLTLGGKTEKDLYFFQAQQKAFQYHGFDRNPWDNAVQYGTAIVDRDTFSRGTGFDAIYHFTICEGTARNTLRAVAERPERFQISINGMPIAPTPDAWWLDKSFGVFDIGSATRTGENELRLHASPFSIYSELEPVYLLGEFSLAGGDRGFAIVPDRPLLKGPWNEQGMPFYAHGVVYTREFVIAGSRATAGRFTVALGSWSGVVANVTVNGAKVGSIAFAPYDLDVTPFIRKGRNVVSVTVYGSLKNTLGPHHNAPQLGRAWPGAFQKGPEGGRAPSAEYSTVGYGMMTDFTLERSGR
jgi:hypothetical protein